MKKRGLVILGVFLLAVVFFFSFVVAEFTVVDRVVDGERSYCPEGSVLNNAGSCTVQDYSIDTTPTDNYDSGYDDEIPNEIYETENLGDYESVHKKDYYEKYETYEGNLEFNAKPGMTPDNTFYFIDNMFENKNTQNPKKALDYKEEKIAEAIVMVNEGKPLEAKEVLEKAEKYNEVIEKEVTPELEAQVEEISMQVQTVLLEMEGDITNNEEWGEVLEQVDTVFENEGNVRKAAEIVATINKLCAELKDLDFNQFAITCRVEGDSPEWMQKEFNQWTIEQEREIKEFGIIMEECISNSGKNCRCDEIKNFDSQIYCEQMSDFALECNEGNEDSCLLMQNIEPPEFPEYLDTSKIETNIKIKQFENFKPVECKDLTAQQCMLEMVKLNAPSECKLPLEEAIKNGKIKTEKEGKDMCDKIMFETNAPQECIDAGIKNPQDCQKLMFKNSMPEECIKIGLDGSNEKDKSKCLTYMQQGSASGADCRNILDSGERLKCFDNANQGLSMNYGIGIMEEGQTTWQCKANQIFNPSDCANFMDQTYPGMKTQQVMQMQEKQMQNQEYQQYAMGGNKCPDGICDNAEQTGMAYCPADCGDIYGNIQQQKSCFYPCYEQPIGSGNCVCPGDQYITQCGPGCWPDPNKQGNCICGQNTIVSNNVVNCGGGCYFDKNTQSCKCPTTQGCQCNNNGNSYWDAQCRCDATDSGNYIRCKSDSDCGSGDQCMEAGTSRSWCNHIMNNQGCQCSWGWSPNCNCGGASGTMTCSVFKADGQSCDPTIGQCCSGTCSNMYGPGTCQPMSGSDPCPADECPNVCCGTTITCASKGGVCCSACSSAGPYISGTECNCCGSCATPTTGYCGNNYCDSGETTTSCPSDCGGGCTAGSCGGGYYCDASGTCMPDVNTGYVCGNGICEGNEYCPEDCDGGGVIGCSCADGYWSDTCDCTGHESSGCDCGDGCYSDSCNCAIDCPPPEEFDCGSGCYSCGGSCDCCEGLPPTGEVVSEDNSSNGWFTRLWKKIFK